MVRQCSAAGKCADVERSTVLGMHGVANPDAIVACVLDTYSSGRYAVLVAGGATELGETGCRLRLRFADDIPPPCAVERFGFHEDLSCKNGAGTQEHGCQ